MVDTSREQAFHRAMLNIYNQALNLTPSYRATYFLKLVEEKGGKAAAIQLISTAHATEGFTRLATYGDEGLKLTVEYLVLQKEWRDLFEPEILEKARKRLRGSKLLALLDNDETVNKSNESAVATKTDFTIEELVQMLKDKGADNISFTMKW